MLAQLAQKFSIMHIVIKNCFVFNQLLINVVLDCEISNKALLLTSIVLLFMTFDCQVIVTILASIVVTAYFLFFEYFILIFLSKIRKSYNYYFI